MCKSNFSKYCLIIQDKKYIYENGTASKIITLIAHFKPVFFANIFRPWGRNSAFDFGVDRSSPFQTRRNLKKILFIVGIVSSHLIHEDLIFCARPFVWPSHLWWSSEAGLSGSDQNDRSASLSLYRYNKTLKQHLTAKNVLVIPFIIMDHPRLLFQLISVFSNDRLYYKWR